MRAAGVATLLILALAATPAAAAPSRRAASRAPSRCRSAAARAGAGCSGSATTLTPTGGTYPTSTLRVQAGSSTPRGTYSLRITARTTSPTLERTVTVPVTVT